MTSKAPADVEGMSDNGLRNLLDPNGFNALRLCRGGPMLFNKNDVYIGGSLDKYGEFSYSEQEVFGKLLREGMIVVEVGANLGAHTVELARMVGRSGSVHAFEPQRLVFQALCANLALNQCTNVFASQAALGSARGNDPGPAPRSRADYQFRRLVARGRDRRRARAADDARRPRPADVPPREDRRGRHGSGGAARRVAHARDVPSPAVRRERPRARNRRRCWSCLPSSDT